MTQVHDSKSPRPRSKPLKTIQRAIAAFFILGLAAGAWAGETGAPTIPLTSQEQQWLAAHPRLRIAPDPDFPPIEWIDRSGQFRGLAADFIALVGKKLGIQFEVVALRNWDQVLQYARERRVDILSAASPSRQRRKYLLFTRPHIVLPGLIFMRKDVPGKFTMAGLRGKKIAVVSQYVWQDYITNDHPDIALVPVPSVTEGMKMVSFGQVDALIGDLATATYYLHKEGITNLRVAGETGYYTYLSLAARSDWPMLTTLLDKALADISPQESQAIISKWITIKQESWFTNPQLWYGLLTGLAVMGLLLIGVAVINRVLTRKVALRTEELTAELSERKRVETALKESEERLRLLADNLPNAMVFQIIAEPDGSRQFTYVSANIQRINEVTAEQVMADADLLYDQVLPEYLSELRAREERSLNSLEMMHCELRARLPSGALRWFDVSSTPRELGGGRVLWDGVAVDITERKQVEERVRQSEARFRASFEHAPVGMALIDTERRLLQVNEKICQALGYRPEEMVGRSFNQFTHPDDRPGGRERWRELLAGEAESNHAEKRYMHKDGHVVWVLVANTLIRGPEGEPLYFVSHLVDISDRKKTEEEKAKLEAQLRQSQKMEAIGVLTGGIAHDFNNLLQAINGYTELLLQEKESGHPDYQKLLRVKTAGDRAARLIEQLLLFSRKAEPEKRPLDLNREVEQTRRILKRTIPKMIDIEFHPNENLWKVSADSVQIEQVLLNLGANAADAMPHGGKFLIETNNVILDESYTREHLGARPGNYVCLSVSDTGHGMDKKTAQHIFEPFYTTKEVGKGTGLGLASVYGIVKNHNGYITCYSEEGIGTIIKIYLPVMDTDDKANQHLASVTPVRGGSEIILLVDDDEAVRDFASQALKNYGYTVMQAADGEEALELYAQNRQLINLIILDIGMPGMGGNQCLRQILQVNPEAKVMVASGYSLNGQVKKTMDLGALDYIGKPYQLSELLRKVRQALDQ